MIDLEVKLHLGIEKVELAANAKDDHRADEDDTGAASPEAAGDLRREATAWLRIVEVVVTHVGDQHPGDVQVDAERLHRNAFVPEAPRHQRLADD